MPLTDVLPKPVCESLAKLYGSEDGHRVVVSTDIGVDGGFGERWLVISHVDLLILSGTDTCEIHLRIPLKTITGARTESLVGVGVLQVDVNGHPMDILQFSNSIVAKFNRVARQIDTIAKGEEVPEAPETEEDRKRCPKCGRLLDNWTNVCPACVNRKKVLKRLLLYVVPYKRVVAIMGVLFLVTTALSMIQPLLTRPLVDNILMPVAKKGSLTSDRLHFLLILVFVMLGVQVVSTVMTIFRGRAAGYLGNKITLDIRNQLYDQLQNLSMNYYDKRQVGAVLTHVTQDTNQLSGFLVEGAQYYGVNVLTIVTIASIMFYMNWRLALLIMLPAPFLVAITLFSWKILMRTWRNFWHSWSRLGAVFTDALTGIKVVKSFGQEDLEVQKFRGPSGQLYDAGLKAEQVGAVVWPVLSFTMLSGSLLVWWFGGRQVILKETTTGTLMTFFAFSGMFYAPLQVLTQISNWMSRSLSAADRIFEVMDTIPEVADAPDAVRMPRIEGAVEFENVSFGYDKHKPVLKGVSFDVKAGEMIGLVGHSGSGKTTTINLISRLYDVTEGRITIDGVDIRKLKVSDLRRQIGVVLQDPFLFNGTVAENIAYSKPDASREEIIAAANAANAHDFIMRFPDGYDTMVRERGGRLSGGERQRISIARAILRNPRILIFDEATSAVDTETEQKLQEAITRLVKGRTTFAIAHRLSTLRNADRLLVLEQGKFVEFGTHEELLKKKGVYYKLVQLQKEVSRVVAVNG